MSTTTKTVAERFQAYLNDAFDREHGAMADDGMEANVFGFMKADPGRWELLSGWLEDLAHRSLIARNDQERTEAVERFANGMRPWIDRYIADWSDEMRIAFMAQIDAETAEAKRLDLAEGNDD